MSFRDLVQEYQLQSEAASFRYSNMPTPLRPTPLTERAQNALFSPETVKSATSNAIAELGDVPVRDADEDNSVETLDNVDFTHHFVDAPGDYDTISWHYVTAGEPDKDAIVFIHGIPDSWYMWHHQMASLAREGYYCIGIDLKGFGQSGKEPGDYRMEGVAEQLHAMLSTIDIKTFYLVSHDRGAVVGDFLTANHPESVKGYARCEQHLYHYNPLLSHHLDLMREAAYNHVLNDPKQVVCMAYRGMSQGKHPVPLQHLRRSVQEFSYPSMDRAIVRYLNASTTEQETKHRRNTQLAEWKCPVVLVIGSESPTQPIEFFEEAEKYIPNALVRLKVMEEAGHFFPMERPEKAVEVIRDMLTLCKEHGGR